jgi:hypothetical protein
LPANSPNLNAYAERFVRSIKHECLRHIVPLGQRHLRAVVREFVEHYHAERNPQGLGNVIPFPSRDSASPVGRVGRRERLGRVLSFYEAKRRVNPSRSRIGTIRGGFRSNSALTKPFNVIAKAMNLTKQISPKAMRRSFQDAMREAEVANVVVRSISGHLTEQMQQRYSMARGHEQEQAIARIVDLTRVKRHVAPSAGSPMDSKVDSIGGQHEKAGGGDFLNRPL